MILDNGDFFLFTHVECYLKAIKAADEIKKEMRESAAKLQQEIISANSATDAKLQQVIPQTKHEIISVKIKIFII